MSLINGAIWILAGLEGGKANSSAFELLTWASRVKAKTGAPITAVILGHDASDEAAVELASRGADEALTLISHEFKFFDLASASLCLADFALARRPSVILAAADCAGRSLMPHLAMRIDAGLTADCTSLDVEDTTGLLLQTRPAIGGNIMATIKTPSRRPQMATIRPKSAPPAELSDRGEGILTMIMANSNDHSPRPRRVGFEPLDAESTIQDATKVVVVGKGIKKPENIALARRLAKALGAALGASREVIDRGWLSFPHQVGLSGKTITPELYVGLGVSGSIQHLAGMQTAQRVVAINIDPDAQIFKVADIGIVGNLFDVVPKLIDEIETSRNASHAQSFQL